MSDLDGWLTDEYAIPAANDLDEEFPKNDG